MEKKSFLSLLVKPASSLCNMRCSYCFYTDEAGRRQLKPGIMSDAVMVKLIDAVFSAAAPGAEISFAFQGGEPTLAGLDFYTRFCDAVHSRNTGNLPVHWSIQTNGLLIDESWGNFLKEHRFLTGLSLDGTAALHDAFRTDTAGHRTCSRVLQSLRLLKRKGVPVNLLCVITEPAARKPKAVYGALKGLGVPFVQFIPCLSPLDPEPRRMPWSLSADSYGRFLCTVFDLWFADWQRGEYLSIRQFEDWIRLAMGQSPDMCASCGSCGGYLVVESDGSLYPCDFYALDEWCLGMVDQGLTAALDSERMRSFRRRSRNLPADCRSCRFFPVCQGGCPRNWQMRGLRIENEFCKSFRMFFEHASPGILQAARVLRAGQLKGE